MRNKNKMKFQRLKASIMEQLYKHEQEEKMSMGIGVRASLDGHIVDFHTL